MSFPTDPAASPKLPTPSSAAPNGRAPRLSSEQVVPPEERHEFMRRLATFGLGEGRNPLLTQPLEGPELRPAEG
jgi:hypothetical protein